jgi:uncharacterized membrane protein
MKLSGKKNYHELFEIGVGLKILIGSLEIILGVALYFISRQNFVIFFTPLLQTPLWQFSSHFFHSFSITGKLFWSIYFFAHGIVNTFLSIYQTVTFINQPALFLGLVTLFDIIIITLVIHEYRYAKNKKVALK